MVFVGVLACTCSPVLSSVHMHFSDCVTFLTMMYIFRLQTLTMHGRLLVPTETQAEMQCIVGCNMPF